MERTYVGEAEDFAVKAVADDRLLLVRDAVIVPEALQQLVLDLPYIKMIRDLAQQQLTRLTPDARGEGRGVGFSAGEVFDALREGKGV